MAGKTDTQSFTDPLLPLRLHFASRTYSLVLANQRRLYPLLFDCAAQSLLEFGRNRLHGDLGITAVLHTWGQKLDFHPHLHCIVTGGALSPDGRKWRSPKQHKFLFPVRAVGALFRGKFLAGLRQILDAGELDLPDSKLKIPVNRARWLSLLYTKRWVLYAKRPFGGPQQVLSYLANYTHRVALSNRRIIALDEQHQSVTFTYRDYRHGSQLKDLPSLFSSSSGVSACISSLRDWCASAIMESSATIAGSAISKQPAQSSIAGGARWILSPRPLPKHRCVVRPAQKPESVW
jgi:Putative transposase